MSKTDEKVALVTGANKGIGFEIARQLAQKKITVLAGARDPDRGMAACEQLHSEGLDVHFIRLNVVRAASIEGAIGKIEDDFGRLDILVNNAGIQIDSQSGILQLDPVVFQNTLETNSFGPLLLAQAAVRLMQANKYGRIVNMASTLGSLAEIARPDSPYDAVRAPAYRLSKTLLNGITVLLAKELRGSNILVNSVCPGWVRTEMGGEEAPLSPAQGADTAIWLATLPDDGPTGGFFRERQPIPW
ncbi:MAG: SDR family oxidoreductase [Deltaproteobacteria bacterium]|jgi:NAD(P)-dependent dehydrogenase (short-subunit alcohol dehydrogenase family)|nr:SDR family oxidoreductase [Deltaproteobacteria bacterium]MBW2470029.1 SDR family oxidoreductase [Deltaproteobacteria bacterium]MBW2488105.1 SDR family oxidoreductase [Deltaproteobacteria bacterium]MBW2517208.1 SDR family oxidoreductase [Deltaproteobacteria bacterium]